MQPSQVMSGPPTPSTPTQPSAPVYGSPQRASPPGTTSDDSDDSVPSHHSQVRFNCLSIDSSLSNFCMTIKIMHAKKTFTNISHTYTSSTVDKVTSLLLAKLFCIHLIDLFSIHKYSSLAFKSIMIVLHIIISNIVRKLLSIENLINWLFVGSCLVMRKAFCLSIIAQRAGSNKLRFIRYRQILSLLLLYLT